MYPDHFSSREFHRLELYQDVARPLGIEDMIRLWLDPNGVDEARLEFDRGRRTFTERDRSVLDLIRPHLEQLRRRARRRRVAATLSSKAARLTMREREVLALVADGRTNAEVARLLWISPQTVRTHLANVFEKLESSHTHGCSRGRAGLVDRGPVPIEKPRSRGFSVAGL